MKENGIETTIKQLELILKARREHKEIIECVGGSCMNCDPDIKALVKSIDILSDYKRVLEINEVLLKENEELLEVKVSTSAHNRILELEKENKELKLYNNSITSQLEQMTTEKFKNGWFHQSEFKDSIPVQKVKDIIDRIDYDIKKTKEIISKNTNIYVSYRKNDYQIVRLKAMNTKSLDIKKRLQELLESEK